MNSSQTTHQQRGEHIPVGILTRNRPAHLDLTLRSLSASALPHEVKVTIYDDASDLWEARRYLYTSETIQAVSLYIPFKLVGNVPNVKTPINLHGIHGRLKIVRLESHLGVLHGSIKALRDLSQMSKAPYVCLLQDDVVFVKDWYNIMCNIVALHRPGILSGVTFGSPAGTQYERQEYKAIKTNFTRAQCLFIARELLECLWLEHSKVDRKQKQGFDALICNVAEKNGFDILANYPSVCQHIGVESLVRPERRFDWKGGRYSRSIQESVVVAKKIRWLSADKNISHDRI